MNSLNGWNQKIEIGTLWRNSNALNFADQKVNYRTMVWLFFKTLQILLYDLETHLR